MERFKYKDGIKEYRSGMNKIVLIFMICLVAGCLTPTTVSATTIIQDTIATSQYRTITIDDDMNIAYIMEYPYKVYVNDSYLGEFKKGESFEIPDGSNVTIYVPSPIKTDISKGIDLGSSLLYIAVLGLLTFGLVIYLIWRFIKRMRH